MSKENGVCKEEVCYCIKDAIVNEDRDCLFIPEGEDRYKTWLDQWCEVDEEEDEAIVIVNPIDEFVIDDEKYFRVIKTIGYSIYDFRHVEEKFGIYVYLVKKYRFNHGHYVFYYKGKQVRKMECPPTYSDVLSIFREFPEFTKCFDDLKAIRNLIDGFDRLRLIITNYL